MKSAYAKFLLHSWSKQNWINWREHNGSDQCAPFLSLRGFLFMKYLFFFWVVEIKTSSFSSNYFSMQ